MSRTVQVVIYAHLSSTPAQAESARTNTASALRSVGVEHKPIIFIQDPAPEYLKPTIHIHVLGEIIPFAMEEVAVGIKKIFGDMVTIRFIDRTLTVIYSMAATAEVVD